jgi:hypothetical protein
MGFWRIILEERSLVTKKNQVPRLTPEQSKATVDVAS